MRYSDIDFINGIKTNDEIILKALYHQYFKMIRHFVITNNGNESDAKDVYHETLLALIQIIQKENFTLTSSLSTFIFAIGKRIWLKKISKNKSTSLKEDLYHSTFEGIKDETEIFINHYEQEESNIQKMHTALQSIGNPCYQLLKEYYFNHLSMEEIAVKLGYNNSDVAKNQKYKCLQRLKKIFFELPKIKIHD
jgi:RNA polymerase sigma factor (sigma-70 family)